MSDNLQTIKQWYLGWSPELVSEDSLWEIPEGYPGGKLYKGKKAVFEEYFPQLTSHFDSWEAHPVEYLDAGDAVVVMGHYAGIVKHTSQNVEIPFTHVWWLKDGKIVRAKPASDTSIFTRALGVVK